MEDQVAIVIGAVVVVVIIIALIKGCVKTFKRNWILALILLLLLTPIWLVWAFVEMFTGDINKAPAQPNQTVQNVNVSYVIDGAEKGQIPVVSPNVGGSYASKSISEAIVIDATIGRGGSLVNETKECPYCAETIRKHAVFCRFCSKELSGVQ